MSAKNNILGIVFYKHDDKHPIRIFEYYNLGNFFFLTRGSIKESAQFATRLIVSRTAKGTHNSISGIKKEEDEEENPLNDFIINAKTEVNGLSISIITDKNYSLRISYQLLIELREEWDKLNHNWINAEKDTCYNFPKVQDLLNKFNNPLQFDKIIKISHEVDQIHDIMIKNIEAILLRGEKIDSLVAKSEELTPLTKQFYGGAKKLNSCCSIL
eukprot:TRINITY_DN17180_c0_g1_i1.p1 TRINITY_DN17180_c0_g1~~TRINITY_DN17180_c0_g1_i1.p1  ORF type:complete len:214 (-),score=49.80 TRINITY_DN17180_c0_g1_i1:34-675(-)